MKKDKNYEAALNSKVNYEAGESTVKGYLEDLLLTMWAEGEGFNGKRPFGNSGWEYTVFEGLARDGHIEATLDEDGFIEKFDREDAEAFVAELISYQFSK